MVRLARMVVLGSCVVACTTTGAPPVAPAEPRADPPPQPTATAAPKPSVSSSRTTAAARHPALREAEASPAPPASGAIGAPCPSDRAWCGSSGTIAVVKEQIVMRREATPCAPRTTTPAVAMEAASACVVADRVFVSRTCVACRLLAEDRLVGRVPDMTAAQLEAAQRLAGLPTRPLLTTVDAWRAAIDAAWSAAQHP